VLSGLQRHQKSGARSRLLLRLVKRLLPDEVGPTWRGLTAVSEYAWIITADHVPLLGDGLASQVGWTGPSDAPDDLQDRSRAGIVSRPDFGR